MSIFVGIFLFASIILATSTKSEYASNVTDSKFSKFTKFTNKARTGLKTVANNPEYRKALQSAALQANKALAANPKTKHVKISPFLTNKRLSLASNLLGKEKTTNEKIKLATNL